MESFIKFLNKIASHVFPSEVDLFLKLKNRNNREKRYTIMTNDNKKRTFRVLNIREVSQYLKVPVSTLYDLAKKGKIPAVKIGKHWRFLEEDLIRFLKGAWNQATQGREGVFGDVSA